MKRALTLLSLILLCACASNDGFVQNTQMCGPGSPIGVDAGWGQSSSADMQRSMNRLTMLVQVSNNSDEEITIKRIFADPQMGNENVPWTLERGSIDPGKAIAEGETATFEVPMNATFRADRRMSGNATSADVSVTVLVEPDASYRCRFRMPMAF